MNTSDGVLFKRKGMVLLQYPNGKEGDYEVPADATGISDYSFEGSEKLTSVFIPSSVTSIGIDPFGGCLRLRSINVSNSNQKFTSIDGVLFSKDGDKLIQYACGKNESYIVPGSASTISKYSFAGCSVIKNVTISPGVKLVDSYAFYECDNLISVTIPSSVTTIGRSPFTSCGNLASIIVDKNNTSYRDIDGVLFNSNMTTLIQYPCGHGSSYEVPDGVTSIGPYCFHQCSNIRSITIPSSVISLELGAMNPITLSYINYLGSFEPSCPDETTTIGTVDVVCVPLDYNSTDFCGRYTVKVRSCEEFVAQQNQCYEVLDWQADTISVKKRANATLWENRRNNCFEYLCSNASGGLAWSKCNSTGDIHRMCIDNECIEETEMNGGDKYGVEMRVNITPSEYDIAVITEILSNATGLLGVEMSVGSEAIQTSGNVVRIVIFVNDEEDAKRIVEIMGNTGADDECSYGILCGAETAELAHTSTSQDEEPTFAVISESNSKNNILMTVVMMHILSMIVLAHVI